MIHQFASRQEGKTIRLAKECVQELSEKGEVTMAAENPYHFKEILMHLGIITEVQQVSDTTYKFIKLNAYTPQ